MKKRILAMSLIVVLTCGQATITDADTISDVKKQKAQTTSQLQATESKIDSLEDQKNELLGQIDTLDAQLIQTIATIDQLKVDLEATEVAIEETQAELVVAQEDRDEQYEAMKKRIQYLYENGGNLSWAMVLLGDGNISDVLESANRTQELYDYDKKALEEYVSVVQQVTELEAQLEAEKNDLESMKHAQEEEQANLETMLAQKQATCENYENQIAQAQQSANRYRELINQQNERIAELVAEQERIAAEEARRAEEAAKNEEKKENSGTSSSGSSSSTGSASGQAIVNYALRFVGNPYVWGGNSLTNGTDCSGFVNLVYAHFGYSVPRQSAAFRSAGRGVSYSDAQPGDVICYSGHVAIYMGNGKIVHAKGAKYGIVSGDSATAGRRILAVRRIV